MTSEIDLNYDDIDYVYKKHSQWEICPLDIGNPNLINAPATSEFTYNEFGQAVYNYGQHCAYGELVDDRDSNKRACDFTLTKLTPNGTASTGYAQEKVDKITDISKHSVIVFEASIDAAVGHHNMMFEELDSVIDRLLCDYAYISGGYLPKINLVGHSKGGLINLMYATEHPEIVDSLISMGTPYNGVKLANLEILNNIDLLMSIDNSGKIIERLNDTLNCGSGLDILNPNMINKLRNDWNEISDYNINATAIGSYCAVNFIYIVASDAKISNEIGNTIVNTLLQIFKIPYSEAILISSLDLFNVISKHDSDLLMSLFGHDNFWHFIIGENSFYDDIFVDLDSQTAPGYDNFNVLKKRFSRNNFNLDKRALPSMPSVGHNLEPRDNEIINMLLSNLSFASSETKYTSTLLSNNTYRIDGAFAIENNSATLELPETINGFPVTEIGPGAFSNDFYGAKIQSVIIPANVQVIGKNAFKDCVNLKNVTFKENSQLETIDESAFEGTALTSLNLPESVKNIYDFAFANTEISSITLSENIAFISSSAFLMCEELTAIEVSINNMQYTSISGVLYTKNKNALVTYPCGKQATIYTVADETIEINDYAFFNSSLWMLNLNNVKNLGNWALKNSEYLVNVSGNKLEIVGEDALSNTLFEAEEDSDFLKLGSCLIKYTGNAPVVSLNDLLGITCIASNAFPFDCGVKKIYIPSSVEYINELAVLSSEIEEIYLADIPQICRFAFPLFNSNLTVFVPGFALEDCDESIQFEGYNLDVAQISLSFDTQTEEEFSDMTFGYYTLTEDLPIPSRLGYSFAGWYDGETDGNGSGKKYDASTYLDSLENLTLHAKWQINNYYLILYNNDGGYGSKTIIFTVNDEINLFANVPAPDRQGYNFRGWNTKADGSGETVSLIPKGTAQTTVLYAQYSPMPFNIYYNLNTDDTTVTIDSPYSDYIFYDSEDYSFDVPSRENYSFDGWYILENNEKVYCTDAQGKGIRPFNYYNKTVYASWSPFKFYIKLNIDGTYRWLGPTGFEDTETYIEYGKTFVCPACLKEEFNSEHISLKNGHIFSEFTDEDEQPLECVGKNADGTHIVPPLGENERVIEIYAAFEKESYTVVFLDDNGNVLKTENYYFGDEIDYPVNLIKTGYDLDKCVVALRRENEVFAGTQFEALNDFADSLMPDITPESEANATIYLSPRWIGKNYTITAQAGNVSVNYTIQFGSNDYRINPPLTPEWRIFGGWYAVINNQNVFYTDGGGSASKAWDIASNTVVYPFFTDLPYPVYYNLNGGVNNSQNPSLHYYSTSLPLYEPVRSGYVFKGWYENADFSGPALTQTPLYRSNALTLHAKWAKIITVTFLDNGSILKTDTAIEGEKIALWQPFKDTYMFTKWSYNNTQYGIDDELFARSSNMTLTANWRYQTLEDIGLKNYGAYYIENFNNGRRINVLNGGYTNATSLMLYDTDNRINQSFVIIDNFDGTVSIVPIYAQTSMLTVQDNSENKGLQLFQRHFNDDQRFYIKKEGDKYLILPKITNYQKHLTTYYGNMNDNIVSSSVCAQNSYWSFVEDLNPAFPILTPNSAYYLRNNNSGEYMDVNNVGGHLSYVSQYDFHGYDNQKFYLLDNRDGTFSFAPAHAQGTRVSVEHDSSKSNAIAMILNVNNSKGQKFKVIGEASGIRAGSFVIYTCTNGDYETVNNKALAIYEASMDGNPVIQFEKRDEKQFYWFFEKAINYVSEGKIETVQLMDYSDTPSREGNPGVWVKFMPEITGVYDITCMSAEINIQVLVYDGNYKSNQVLNTVTNATTVMLEANKTYFIHLSSSNGEGKYVNFILRR